MDQSLNWILRDCTMPILHQGAMISVPILLSGITIRLCVLLKLSSIIIHSLSTLMGLYMLWLFYSTQTVYFIVLCVTIYSVLRMMSSHRGVVVAVISVAFLLICELFIARAQDWHQVRGSFLVMVMRIISLGFDLDPTFAAKDGEKKPPKVMYLPNFMEYMGYCLFPTTSIFGPFLGFNEHTQLLDPSPISVSWLSNVMKAWLGSMFCLGVSSCIMPFLFNEPHWNKWLAAYTAAASFRYSHYFVSLLSQFGAILSGIGKTTSNEWSGFHVVHPLSVELPRSLGTVVTNWNLPMHIFLKNYVYKPSRSYTGKFGAILLTYLSSALLHGLNFQLGAVLLSIGVYAYIENVLRYKLSKKLDACILDHPCPDRCNHTYKKTIFWVSMLNIGFTVLAMYHLAYLGLMFGSRSPEEDDLKLQGFSMMHTLRKWSHLNFLSHWIVLVSYLFTIVIDYV